MKDLSDVMVCVLEAGPMCQTDMKDAEEDHGTTTNLPCTMGSPVFSVAYKCRTASHCPPLTSQGGCQQGKMHKTSFWFCIFLLCPFSCARDHAWVSNKEIFRVLGLSLFFPHSGLLTQQLVYFGLPSIRNKKVSYFLCLFPQLCFMVFL